MTRQLDMLHDHLVNVGNISALEAHAIYRVGSLSRRIVDLKQLGLPIRAERKQDNTGRAYVRYYHDAAVAA